MRTKLRLILIRCVSVTIIVFGSMGFISILSQFKLFTAFDLIYQAVSDMQLTDYAFSYLREAPKTDQRIVIVNIGNLSRRDIALQIARVNQCEPRVIGLDAFFNCEGGLRDSVNCPQLLDPIGNIMLREAIREADNVVLVSKLMQTEALAQQDVNEFDSLELSDPDFQQYARHGFATLPTDAKYQDDVKICRTVWPTMQVDSLVENAFAVEVALLYDSLAAQKFLNRRKSEEIINFKGNAEVINVSEHSLKSSDLGTTHFNALFGTIDAQDVLDGRFHPDFFKDKIVLLGYIGEYIGQASWEDRLFTPMNRKLGGRATPDMFGVVVHANIVSMILDEDYVGELTDWVKWFIAIVSCLLTVRIFIYIDVYLPIWYDAMSVGVQLVQLFILMGIVVWTFAKFTFSLELELTFGATALVGPCYDIYKGIENQLKYTNYKK